MDFLIRRTSVWDDEVQPCDEAKLVDVIRVDIRTTTNHKEIPAHYYENNSWWFSEGTNHRIENGCIKRDLSYKAWTIEINSLEELITFKNKYGPIVIENSYINENLMQIEIYDDYRE